MHKRIKTMNLPPSESKILGEMCLSPEFEAILRSDQNTQEALIAAATAVVRRRRPQLPRLATALKEFSEGTSTVVLILKGLPDVEEEQQPALSALLASMVGTPVNDGNPGRYITRVADQGVFGARTGDATRGAFPHHNDGAYLDPPNEIRMMMLRSIRNSQRDGGLSGFSDADEAFELLNEADRIELVKPQYMVLSPKNHTTGKHACERFPIIMIDACGHVISRFRRDGLDCDSPEGMIAALHYAQALQRVAYVTFLPPHSAAFVNNQGATHARKGYLPSLHPRLLHRVYIQPFA